MTVRERENLAERTGERWQPPAFTYADSPLARAVAAVRRFFDLQAGSLWRDLKPALSVVQGTVLDVGCGAQPYRGLMPVDVAYIGLDTDDAGVDFGYSLPGVLRIDTTGRWPIADAHADVVLATETLEHVRDPALFLAEAHRCLRPGGKIILTVPFSARWHYIPHDYWRLTPSGLRLLLEQAGFVDIIVNGRGNEWTVACYKLMAPLLAFALPQVEPGSMRPRLRGLLAAPVITLLALLARVSLGGGSGDDCLGYTTYAMRLVDDSEV
jgi:SAM-dependent methyltransferase